VDDPMARDLPDLIGEACTRKCPWPCSGRVIPSKPWRAHQYVLRAGLRIMILLEPLSIQPKWALSSCAVH